ncbi:MAG: hypothetical protein PHI97_34290 [Desulfobulbus sp.]|nr:hypothetical protein [Desulfobulbus sp.]
MNTTNHAAPKDRRKFWQAHVKALADSGLSRREYCHQHHLAYHALTYWVGKQGARTLPFPNFPWFRPPDLDNFTRYLR